MHAFTNGRHQFKGKFNGSGVRKRAKLYKGIKYDHKELGSAFNKIESELYDNERRIQTGRNRLTREALPERKRRER